MSLTIADSFIYFHKGEFPCLFMMEVQEGFARFEVKDGENLKTLLKYSMGKGFSVQWARAVADDPKNRQVFEGYPGGQYVASTQSVEESNPKES